MFSVFLVLYRYWPLVSLLFLLFITVVSLIILLSAFMMVLVLLAFINLLFFSLIKRFLLNLQSALLRIVAPHCVLPLEFIHESLREELSTLHLGPPRSLRQYIACVSWRVRSDWGVSIAALVHMPYLRLRIIGALIISVCSCCSVLPGLHLCATTSYWWVDTVNLEVGVLRVERGIHVTAVVAVDACALRELTFPHDLNVIAALVWVQSVKDGGSSHWGAVFNHLRWLQSANSWGFSISVKVVNNHVISFLRVVVFLFLVRILYVFV